MCLYVCVCDCVGTSVNTRRLVLVMSRGVNSGAKITGHKAPLLFLSWSITQAVAQCVSQQLQRTVQLEILFSCVPAPAFSIYMLFFLSPFHFHLFI